MLNFLRTLRGQVIVVAMLLGLVAVAYYFFTSPSGSAGGSAYKARPVSVIVAPAKEQEIAFAFEGVGSLKANESINVTAKESGIVESIHFIEGEHVESDHLLLSLNESELKAELEVAQAQRDQAKLGAARAERLLKSKSVSREQFDSLRAELRAANARVLAAGARLKEMMIRAPFSGVVGLRQVSLGALVSPNMVITTLDDIDTMKLDFTVPEVYIAYLKNDIPILARTAAYKDREFKGIISAVDTRLDPLTRSIKVQAIIKNTERLLKPGLFMNVTLALDKREKAITVPEQALISKGLKQYVYVVREEKAVLQEVELGFRQPGLVEVLSGVSADESVVVNGLQKLRPNAAVITTEAK